MPSVTCLASYTDKYEVATLDRSEDGVLTVVLHGIDASESLSWGVDDEHDADLADLFADIAHDPDNRAVILTGTGPSFIDVIGGVTHTARYHSPETFDACFRFQRRLHANLLDVEVPIIAAINGPARVHSELALMCDIVLATESTTFQDKVHFDAGIPPGDGVQLVYTALLGPTRAKYFLLTGQVIDASEALQLGLINEIVQDEGLMPRATELAQLVIKRPPLTVRYTRRLLNEPLRKLLADHLDYGLALESLGISQIRGWRMHMGGAPPQLTAPDFHAVRD